MVIFMLAILMISLSIAAPRIKQNIQRDREVETMQRGKQYARAIRLYYRKLGAYPMSVDALVNTGGIRFLRKKYKDPTTGKEEWKPIGVGQNKVPTMMGFFGQPLLGIGGMPGGLAPNGVNGVTNASTVAAGSLSNSDSTDSGTNSPGSTGANGSSNDSGQDTGPTGQTFGGMGIMGFSPNSPNQSILMYKKKNHYNEWEFVYDPRADQMGLRTNPQPSPGPQPGAPGFSPPGPGTGQSPPPPSQ
jgi:type II secretory pathway pseudopilin PulG